jgi:hypothetical protein
LEDQPVLWRLALASQAGGQATVRDRFLGGLKLVLSLKRKLNVVVGFCGFCSFVFTSV